MHMLDARGPSRDHHGPRCTPSAGCFPGNSPVDEPAAGAGGKICSAPQNIPMSSS